MKDLDKYAEKSRKLMHRMLDGETLKIGPYELKYMDNYITSNRSDASMFLYRIVDKTDAGEWRWMIRDVWHSVIEHGYPWYRICALPVVCRVSNDNDPPIKSDPVRAIVTVRNDKSFLDDSSYVWTYAKPVSKDLFHET